MVVLITSSAEEEFEKLNEEMSGRIRDVFQRLERYPEVSGVGPLYGEWAGHKKARSGKWRVIFRVEHDTIVVVKIDKRDQVYKKR